MEAGPALVSSTPVLSDGTRNGAGLDPVAAPPELQPVPFATKNLPSGKAESGEPIPPRLPGLFRQAGPAGTIPTPSFAEKGESQLWVPHTSPAPDAAGDSGAGPQGPPAVVSRWDELDALPLNPPPRSEDLEFVARDADVRTRRAFELAGRHAYFSSRAEFIGALRLLTQGLDTQRRTHIYSRSLAEGLTALAECDDFVPRGSQLEADLDLKGIVSCHRTPVLKDADLSDMTPMAALQCYLSYAQEQLAAATGKEVAGSMALRGLGKLHETLGERNVLGIKAPRPKAVTFFQAALLACPENHLASNDLGVMLARNGRFDEARLALEHSLSLAQQPTGWHNLAAVYSQLGDAQRARQAEQRASALQQASTQKGAGQSVAAPQVVWLDPAAFSQIGGEPTAALPVQAPVAGAAAPTTAPGQKVSRTLFGRGSEKR